MWNSLFRGFENAHTSLVQSRRHRPRLTGGASRKLCVEQLETRSLLSTHLFDVVPVVAVPSGQSFQVPLDGRDTESKLDYGCTSLSPSVTCEITQGNPSVSLFITGPDANLDGNPDWAGKLVLQLFQDLTPKTTARITELINSGFYENMSIHRVIDDFVMQFGDPNCRQPQPQKPCGSGGTSVMFEDEFTTRLMFTGFGQLAMANKGDDTNDSQMFITDIDLSLQNLIPKRPPQHLNFSHTTFGQLTDGFETMARIMTTPVSGPNRSTPTPPIFVSHAEVFNDMQNGVMRITAPEGFEGIRQVIVSAKNGAGERTEKTVQVTVIPDTVNDPPFLESISDLTIPQGTSVCVTLTGIDLQRDPLFYELEVIHTSPRADVDVTGCGAPNVFRSTPPSGFFGYIDLLARVRESTTLTCGRCDSEEFRLDVKRTVPPPPSPPLTISIDTTPPIIQKLELFRGRRSSISQIALTFSEDVQNAGDPENYMLTLRTRRQMETEFPTANTNGRWPMA